jgi:hypothetical protein
MGVACLLFIILSGVYIYDVVRNDGDKSVILMYFILAAAALAVALPDGISLAVNASIVHAMKEMLVGVRCSPSATSTCICHV